jgi:hypothetical protein
VHVPTDSVIVRTWLVEWEFQYRTKVPNDPKLFFSRRVFIAHNPEYASFTLSLPLVSDAASIYGFGQKHMTTQVAFARSTSSTPNLVARLAFQH